MDAAITQLRQMVWDYYEGHGRHDLPWRRTSCGELDPYGVLVSELMLQQTQVPRVVPKFGVFMQAFPTFETLSGASLGDVLRVWSGLGYNRRAKFLWQAAQAVVGEHAGHLPDTRDALVTLPGVGSNTAGAILAYAFDQPAIFIETNIRTVFIHHFFAGQEQVRDAEIAALVEQALSGVPSPRMWYWALMDYGTYLKQTNGNVARASREYARQSKFEGSRRQVRGQILRELTQGPIAPEALAERLADPRLGGVLADLLQEGLIQDAAGMYALA